MTAPNPLSPYRTVDAAPVRAHLHSIGVGAVGHHAIADLAGVPAHTVKQILHGRRDQPQRTVRMATARKILAVTGVAMVDAIGTRRRIRALYCNGYDAARIGADLGVPPATVRTWVRSRVIATCYADRIADLYGRWAGTPAEENGSSPVNAQAARTLARRRRWHPAACWAGEDIDDPATVPTSNRTTWRSEELVAEAEYLRSQTGDSWAKIASQIGVAVDTLEKARERVAARAKAGAA